MRTVPHCLFVRHTSRIQHCLKQISDSAPTNNGDCPSYLCTGEIMTPSKVRGVFIKPEPSILICASLKMGEVEESGLLGLILILQVEGCHYKSFAALSHRQVYYN